MPDIAATGDARVVEVDVGTPSGGADAVRDPRRTGVDGAGLTGTPDVPATPGRGERQR